MKHRITWLFLIIWLALFYIVIVTLAIKMPQILYKGGTMPLEVKNGPHIMPSISMEYPTERQRGFIHNTITCRWTDDIRYQLARRAGAFLQCNTRDYILIEFWNKDYEPFVEWLNNNLPLKEEQ